MGNPCVCGKNDPDDPTLRVAPIPIATGQNDHDRYIEQNFIIGRTLGDGASCRVVESTERKTNNKYALKIMPKSKEENESLYNIETSILELLDHPNVVVFKDGFVGAEYFYILTGMCDGGELFDRIVDPKIEITEAEAGKMIRSTLLAIQHCHQKQIVHRDLKAENFVFKTKSLNSPLVLIDFGCAKVVEDDKEYSDFVGTPFYIAPESASPKSVRTGKTLKSSDIWSIGVLAYIIMTGRPPFNGRSNVQILKNILTAQMKLPKNIEVSEGFTDFIMNILVKSPKSRMSLKAALDYPWVNGKATTKISEGVIKELRQFHQQSKLKKALTKVLAENICGEQEEEIRAHFNRIDKNKNGKLCSKEIANLFMDMGYSTHKANEEARKIMSHSLLSTGEQAPLISPSEDKQIEFAEFSQVWQRMMLSKNNKYIHAVFNVLDTNGNGKLDSTELATALRMGNKDGENLEKLIKEVDTDGDGVINFKEFKMAMTNNDDFGGEGAEIGRKLDLDDIYKANRDARNISG